MDEKSDIRWIQRMANYEKALAQLKKAVEKAEEEELSDLEEQGLIQSFEYTHELAWSVMKDYFEYQGNTEITGSRDAIREAFNRGLIKNGDTWMDTINSRNKTSHTYNEETAEEIATAIVEDYYLIFEEFRKKMNEIRFGEQGTVL
ncbi:MAG: nucleotidyltransferase [Cytophagales bacterium]|nr:nucleotidyltransferase [Cytophagales bacterium]